MKKRGTAKVVVAALAAVVFLASPVIAMELVVVDCNGTLSAVKDVDAHGTQAIQFKTDRGVAQAFSLSNTQSEDKLSAISEDGVVVFPNVKPGTWKLCPASPLASVKNVSIVDGSGLSTTTTASLIGVGIAGGAAAILGSGSGSGSATGSSALITGAAPVNQAVAANHVSSGTVSSHTTSGSTGVASTAKRPRPNADEDCMLDEEPDPVSPF